MFSFPFISYIMPSGNNILAQSNITQQMWNTIFLDWTLPAQGDPYTDKPYTQNCGDWRIKGCKGEFTHPKQVVVRHYQSSCRRKECPVCYESWCGDRARDIENKLKQVPHYWEPSHFEIEADPKDVINLPYRELRKKMYKKAQSRGITGGVAIFHPFRNRKSEWNPFELWYRSPHWHILGYGKVEKTAELYQKDSWFVKVILTANKKGEFIRDTFQTALYQLSHCGVHQKERAITWFGKCSQASIVQVQLLGGKSVRIRVQIKPLEKISAKCPICESQLVNLTYIGHEPLIKEKNKFFFYENPDDWVHV